MAGVGMHLTVVMPVYNAMPYLPDTVASLFAQTYRDFRLLAVDDGSSDDSLAFLKSITDPSLEILHTETRGGQGAARNRVIHDCETEYLAFSDADDISLPERFSRQIAFLDAHPEVGMLGTQVSFIGNTGRPGLSPPLATDHASIRRDLLLCRHSIANCTLMFRTEVLKRVGGFRIAGAGEDWDLFLRVSEASQAANLREVLCHYRVHASSASASQALTLARRYAHACACASFREQCLPEPSFEEFLVLLAQQPIWTRAAERLDLISGLQYRRAVAEILEGAKIRGYGRMAAAALISPRKLFQRISREMRCRRRNRSAELATPDPTLDG